MSCFFVISYWHNIIYVLDFLIYIVIDAENIADEARNSISQYCIDECRAYCCRKGFLILNQSQKQLIAPDESLKQLENNMFSLNLSPKCPMLNDDFMCTIYTDKLRPDACREFPLFISEKNIHLSSRCPAVREGKFFPYIKQLQMMGYRLKPLDT